MNYLYRMTHIDNISHILEHGITHQSSINCNPNYVNKIGFVSPARRYEAPTVVRPPQM